MSKQEQNDPQPKVEVFIPLHETLEVTKCKKCGKVLAEPKELQNWGEVNE